MFYFDYCFVGIDLEDDENFINCLFYLIFYLICEESMEKVLKYYLNLEVILEINIVRVSSFFV